MKNENRSERTDVYRRLFLPNGDRGYRICLSNASRTSTKYQDRPAAADIAFCVAAYADGMTEDRIERALEDDYGPVPCRLLAQNQCGTHDPVGDSLTGSDSPLDKD